ncbi:hypothetical protein QJS10_CPB15g01574 [Acorus calamus]|uniref:FRIGIDA-like protein n=1 Tax=Acorus calamus TaxID=4465 RepID=A0AAV9D382_ACOCL|nr:hypothetical protein QJS10_CPB15g01574 [Acorus calamus]
MRDSIDKLVKKGKELDALRIVFAFELVNKIPPVPFLKAYGKGSKKTLKKCVTREATPFSHGQ